jgi:hypothetical protein
LHAKNTDIRHLKIHGDHPMSAILYLPRQIWRGSTNLPHVGRHPGTDFVVIMTLITGLAGAQQGGLAGFALGVLFAATLYGSFYAVGAVSRANMSDRFVRRERLRALIQAWTSTLDLSEDTKLRILFVKDKTGRKTQIRAHAFALSHGPTVEIAVPSYLADEIMRVLTRPVGAKRGRYQPKADDLQRFETQVPSLTAHERIEAIATLAAIDGYTP